MPSLTMPLFVTPADVILRMQLSADLTGIEDVITSGIIGAQLHVQRIIDGRLQRQSQDALYYIDAESFSGIVPHGTYRLEVPSGFIRQDTDVMVTASAPRAGAFEDHEDVDPLLMRVDHARGYVYMDAGTYGNCHVRIQCDTGFEDGTTPYPIEDLDEWANDVEYTTGQQVQMGGLAYTCIVPTDIDVPPDENPAYWELAYVAMESIPAEVKEAIIALVPMVFNSNQTTNRSDEAQKQYRVATDHAELLLQPYVRTKGFTFRAA